MSVFYLLDSGGGSWKDTHHLMGQKDLAEGFRMLGQDKQPTLSGWADMTPGSLYREAGGWKGRVWGGCDLKMHRGEADVFTSLRECGASKGAEGWGQGWLPTESPQESQSAYSLTQNKSSWEHQNPKSKLRLVTDLSVSGLIAMIHKVLTTNWRLLCFTLF